MKRFPIILVLTIASAWAFAAAAAETDSVAAAEVKALKLERNTGHFVYVSGGAGQILSDVDAGYIASGDPQLSGQMKIGYDYISNKKFGIGFLYSGYYSGFKTAIPSGYYVAFAKENWAFNYFAPQFVGRILFKSPKWSMRYAIGFGLMMLYQGASSGGKAIARNYDYGAGANLSFGITYHVNSRIGINLALSYISASIKQSYINIDQTSGVERVDVDFGVSYHF